MTDIVAAIRSGGHWRIVVRPRKFEPQRIADILELRQVVRACSVRLRRGWDFPHVRSDEDIEILDEYVQHGTELRDIVELWRMYQSGQFVYLGGIASDWRGQSRSSCCGREWQPEPVLGIGSAIYRFQEAFEFAARLSQSTAGSDVMHIGVRLIGLRGRRLQMDVSGKIGFSMPKRASVDMWPKEADIRRHDLVVTSGELALQWARDLFRRFGWDPDVAVLRDFNRH